MPQNDNLPFQILIQIDDWRECRCQLKIDLINFLTPPILHISKSKETWDQGGQARYYLSVL